MLPVPIRNALWIGFKRLVKVALVLVPWELFKDRAANWANTTIDSQSEPVMELLVPIIRDIAIAPLGYTIIVAVIIFVLIFIHAYYKENSSAKKPLDGNKISDKKDHKTGESIAISKFYLVDVLFEGIMVPNKVRNTSSHWNYVVLEVKAENADLLNACGYMVSAEKIDKEGKSKEIANIPKPIELRWLCDKHLKKGTIYAEEVVRLALLRTINSWVTVGESDPLIFCEHPGYRIDYPPTLEGFFMTCEHYRVGLRLTADNADKEEFFVEFYFCSENDEQVENRVNKIHDAKILPYRV